MDSNVITLVTLFLPLSAIWAAATIGGPPRSNAILSPRPNTWGDGSTLRGSATLSGSATSLRKEKTARRYSPTTGVVSQLDATQLDTPRGAVTGASSGQVSDVEYCAVSPIDRSQGAADLPIELVLQPGRGQRGDGPYHELNG
jgi:hypothetical protein